MSHPRPMHRALCPILAPLLALLPACQDAAGPLAAPAGLDRCRESTAVGTPGVVSGSFIVRLRDGADGSAVAREHGIAPTAVFSEALDGFAGEIPAAARAALASDPRIVSIEPDRIVTTSGRQIKAPWGLDRIDQTHIPLNSTYNYSATGRGVTAYIVDSGIRLDHQLLDGRASVGYDGVGDGMNGWDCSGHGTHVAGIVGGWSTGVAKEVRLVSVRVFDARNVGTLSGVIAGIDWVTANRRLPAVANLSFNAPPSAALDDAVQRMIASGVVAVVSAGNAGAAGAEDACGNSPARVADALTIGASDETDARAPWSNYGSCVDWFAPGAGILSAGHSAPNALAYASGTSMAAPFTAGVAALYLQKNPGASPRQVAEALRSGANDRTVRNAASASDALLYSDIS